jgi:hypothetical protein
MDATNLLVFVSHCPRGIKNEQMNE